MKRRVLFCLALGLFLGTGEFLRHRLPEYLVYQPSISLPKGWYRRSLGTTPLAVGDLVNFDVPASMRASMPPEVPCATVLKQVVGLEGDAVCWTEDGMDVHGAHYAFVEGFVGVTPHGCLTLGADEMVVVGTHPRSYDSRYVGTVPRRLIRWRAVPLWTWEGR